MCAVFGWVTSASPTSGPRPVTTLTTPLGISASMMSSASSSIDAEVNSEGLMTAVQPAASAGASFQLVSVRGEFHGELAVIAALGFSELRGIGLDEVAKPPQQVAALGRAQARPWAVKRAVGGFDGRIRIVRSAARNLCPCRAGKRILGWKIRAGRRGDARAVDEMPVAPKVPGHGHLSSRCLPAAHQTRVVVTETGRVPSYSAQHNIILFLLSVILGPSARRERSASRRCDERAEPRDLFAPP